MSGAEVLASSAGGVFSGAFSEFLVSDKDDVGADSVADGEFVCDSFMKASQRKICGRKAEIDCGANFRSITGVPRRLSRNGAFLREILIATGLPNLNWLYRVTAPLLSGTGSRRATHVLVSTEFSF